MLLLLILFGGEGGASAEDLGVMAAKGTEADRECLGTRKAAAQYTPLVGWPKIFRPRATTCQQGGP